MATWLLIDANFLAHRAKHSTGTMTFEGIGTGVAFGVLRDIETFVGLFTPHHVVIAFDFPGHSLRKQILPTYKANREKPDLKPEEIALERLFHQQVDRLKQDLLPKIGYRNIVEVRGYEGDDILAQYARDLPKGDDAVIVSSDGDLLQCLRSCVRCYNPTNKKITTSAEFLREWGIDPLQWASVKAIAGCASDNVEGLDGIGPKSAAGFFSGKLKPNKAKPGQPPTGKYHTIEKNLDILQRNLPLVKLPFPGLVLPEIQQDQITLSSKSAVMVELGINPPRGSDRARARGKVIDKEDGGFDLATY